MESKLRLRHPVQLDDPAVGDHQSRLRVVRGAQRDQPEVGVLDREAVQVDPLGVHEPDPADRPLAAWPSWRSLRRSLAASVPGASSSAVCGRSSMTRAAARCPGCASPARRRPGPGVRTTIRVRSPRNRSWENSNGSSPVSVVVRVMDSSGAPAGTSRTSASSADAVTTSMRSTASFGPGAEVLVEQLVHRAAERQLQQPGEPVGGQHDVLHRDRAAVREPDPHQVDDQVTALEPERPGRRLVGRRPARR